MVKVAKVCNTDTMSVLEVASFYTMFNRTKVGKYFIQLCGTTPCMICGSEEIKKVIEDHLHIKVIQGIIYYCFVNLLWRYNQEGEDTEDGMFTLREVECMGTCANAPMVQINDDYYECLTPETTRQLLDACKAGKPPKMGKWGSLPMNGQVSCEGPLGKTSLFEVPMDFMSKMRKDTNFEQKVNPADVKKTMGYQSSNSSVVNVN